MYLKVFSSLLDSNKLIWYNFFNLNVGGFRRHVESASGNSFEAPASRQSPKRGDEIEKEARIILKAQCAQAYVGILMEAY